MTQPLEIINLHPDRECRAYLLVDRARGEAALLDGRFDLVPRYLERLKKDGLKLRYAIDTHTHADHLSASDRLRNLTGCRVLMSGQTRSHVPDIKVRDDEVLQLGENSLRFLHTPGHTPDSMCVLTDHSLLCGDTLFIGSCARTDFMGGSAAALFDSFRRIEALGGDTTVLPGHDYNQKVSTTVARELRDNAVFAEHDKQALIRRLDVKGALPMNMSEMLAFNVDAGIGETSIISPRDAAFDEDAAGRFTVLDVRTDVELAAARIPGARHIVLTELDQHIEELRNVKLPVLSVCRSGVRATLAMMMARRHGLGGWMLLEGGMEAWARAGRPMVADGGRKPAVIPMPAGAGGGSCAAGAGCAAPPPAAAVRTAAGAHTQVFSQAAHGWSDWVI